MVYIVILTYCVLMQTWSVIDIDFMTGKQVSEVIKSKKIEQVKSDVPSSTLIHDCPTSRGDSGADSDEKAITILSSSDEEPQHTPIMNPTCPTLDADADAESSFELALLESDALKVLGEHKPES